MSLGSSRRFGATLAAVGFFIGATIVYFSKLDGVAPFAAPDEVLIGLMAHSIRTTGHDLNGRFLPMYFEVPPLSWYQPLAVYAEAAAQLIGPFTIGTLRTPSVLIGLGNGGLIWAILARLTGRTLFGAVGAALLLAAPAHMILSRLALDYIYPLPFMLTWLYCVVRFDQSLDRRWLRWSALALGAGMFSYPSAFVLMPALMAATAVVVWVSFGDVKYLTALLPGVLIPAVMVGAWLVTHPEMFGDTIARYSVYETALNPLQGVRAFFSYANVARKLSQYWDYLNPAFLFMDAAAASLFSVRGWGLVLSAMAPMCVLGFWRSANARPLTRAVLLSATLLAAIPAAMVEEADAVQRVLPLVPLLVVFAVLGAERAWQWSASPALLRRLQFSAYVLAGAAAVMAVTTFVGEARLSGSALPAFSLAAITLAACRWPHRLSLGKAVVASFLLVSGAQGLQFQRDYHDAYGARFRDVVRGNLPAALSAVLEESAVTTPSAVYVDAYVDMIREYWRFATIEQSQEELWPVTSFFEPQDWTVARMLPGSLILSRTEAAGFATTAGPGELDLIRNITEPDGRVIYAVYRRR